MAGWGKAATLAEARGAFASIEDNGGEWFSNLLANDDELARWIGKGQVSLAATPTTAVLLRQRYGCQRLYFASTKREALAEDLRVYLANIPEKVITTVLDRDGENEEIKDTLREAGFSFYARVNRIVKINDPKPPTDVSVEFATEKDLLRIEEMIKRYFDPLLDHYPDRDEIMADIEAKRVIVVRQPDGKAGAFRSFERKGKTVWGRYWASMEECRSKIPYGALLIHQYFMMFADVRKYIGWVREGNVVSTKANLKMGMRFDGTTETYFLYAPMQEGLQTAQLFLA